MKNLLHVLHGRDDVEGSMQIMNVSSTISAIIVDYLLEPRLRAEWDVLVA